MLAAKIFTIMCVLSLACLLVPGLPQIPFIIFATMFGFMAVIFLLVDKKAVNATTSSTTSENIGETQVNIATSGQRLANFFLDLLFIYILAILIGIGLDLAGLGENKSIEFILNDITIFCLYYVPQEAFFGKTLGKRLSKTIVINETGGKISVGQAIGRTICRFIPFEAFSFLGQNGRPIGWHDRISKTKVIAI